MSNSRKRRGPTPRRKPSPFATGGTIPAHSTSSDRIPAMLDSHPPAFAPEEDPSIWIVSTRDRQDLGPACQLTWGALEWYAAVADVQATAEDLFTVAAYAEMIGELLRAGIAGNAIERMVQAMMISTDRTYFGAKETITLTPAGSSQRGVGVVMLNRGSMSGFVSPNEARTMGRAWLQAAEASEADTIFGQVLERSGWMGEMELDALFGLLKDIRSGTATVPPLLPGHPSEL